MEHNRRLAVMIIRIYGASFLFIGFGWGLVSMGTILTGPQWKPRAESYLAETSAYFVAGASFIGLSRSVASFSARP